MKSVAVVELSVVVGEGSVDISKTSAAAVVELVVLEVGSAAMAMGPVVKVDGSVAVEVCITSDTTVVDSVAEVEGSAAVVETVVGSTTVAGAIGPNVVELERISDTL